MPEINQDIQLQDDPNIQVGGNDEIIPPEPVLIPDENYEVKEDFIYNDVVAHQLCAIVDSDAKIVGTGIAKEVVPGQLDITVDGTTYSFDSYGNPINTNATKGNFKLKLAESKLNGISKGDASSNIGKAYTRSVTEEGKVKFEPVEDKLDTGITIDSLNARDQFAIQALRGILERVPNPDNLSKNEMTHYCEAAYNWASFMMEFSSKTRSIILESDQSYAQSSEVTAFDTNTEKLLNNLILELQRTDAASDNEYAKRNINPTLNTFISNYVKGATEGTTVGLKDLIAAISSGGTDLSGLIAALSQLGGTLNIGNSGLGNSSNPLHISTVEEAKYTPYAIYQYRNKGEAESDGWDFDSQNNVWKKAYYNDVPGSYTDESAKTLPTWKNVVKVSIVEMADLIDAIHDVADAIRNQ